jgi:quercetin dioxygenase-like cupin family protein
MKPVKISELKGLRLLDGVTARVVTSDTMTVSNVMIKEGTILPVHSHHHEQIVIMLEGELEVTVEDDSFVMDAGMSLVLSPNMPHSGKALTDVKVIDVFHPIREDLHINEERV